MKLRSTGSIQQEINRESKFHESDIRSLTGLIQRPDEHIKETEVNQIRMDNHIKLINKPDESGYALAQEFMAKIIVHLKRDHQEEMLKLVTAVQELKVMTQSGKELKL